MAEIQRKSVKENDECKRKEWKQKIKWKKSERMIINKRRNKELKIARWTIEVLPKGGKEFMKNTLYCMFCVVPNYSSYSTLL